MSYLKHTYYENSKPKITKTEEALVENIGH